MVCVAPFGCSDNSVKNGESSDSSGSVVPFPLKSHKITGLYYNQ